MTVLAPDHCYTYCVVPSMYYTIKKSMNQYCDVLWRLPFFGRSRFENPRFIGAPIIPAAELAVNQDSLSGCFEQLV